MKTRIPLRRTDIVLFMFLAVLSVLCLVGVATAEQFFTKDGAAIRGYDPVAYFTDGRAIKGAPEFTAAHGGATFQFVSAANRDAFVANPARFTPEYGGFCAYGMAKGYKATTDPDAFTIVGGKLYLNYSLKVRSLWQADIPGYIAKADKHWPEVKNSTKVAE